MPDARDSSLHLIEKTIPNHVLAKCFFALASVTRIFGILPVTIRSDGLAEFGWFSWPTFHSVLLTGMFIGESAFFFPFYWHVALKSTLFGEPIVTYIPKLVFGGGQYVAAFFSVLLIPYIAPRLVTFYNKLHVSVTFLNCYGSSKVFIYPYRRSRLSLLAFFGIMGSYGAACWWYYKIPLERFYSKDTNESFWLMVALSISFSCICITHVLHSLVFLFFMYLMRTCFSALTQMTIEYQDSLNKGYGAFNKIGGFRFMSSSKRLEELVKVYRDLNMSVKALGRVFGYYMLIEMLVVMVSIVMNVFILCLTVQVTSLGVVITSLVSYSVWLLSMTNSGDWLTEKAEECRMALKEAVYTCSLKESVPLMEKMLDPPWPITATNFYRLNRKLLTRIIGTIGTYLVVLLQFKFSQDENSVGWNNSNSTATSTSSPSNFVM